MVDEEAFRERVQDRLRDAQDAEGGVDPRKAARQIAEEVVETHDISTTDYIVFQSKMDAEGIDRGTTRQLWDELKEDGVIESPGDDEPEKQDELVESIDGMDADAGEIGDVYLTDDGSDQATFVKEMMSRWIEDGSLAVVTPEDDVYSEIESVLGEPDHPQLVADLQEGFEAV